MKSDINKITEYMRDIYRTQGRTKMSKLSLSKVAGRIDKPHEDIDKLVSFMAKTGILKINGNDCSLTKLYTADIVESKHIGEVK